MRADSRFVTLPPDAGDYQGEAVFEDGVGQVAEISENAEAATDSKDAAGEDGADKDQSGIQACVEQLAELAA